MKDHANLPISMFIENIFKMMPNFILLISEYKNFVKKCPTSGIPNFDKAVVFKAFEHLTALELIRGTDTLSQNNLMKEFKLMTMLIESSQIRETLQSYPDCPTELRNWGDSMFA